MTNKLALFVASVKNYSGFYDLKRLSAASSRVQIFPAANACETLGLQTKALALSTDNLEELNISFTPKICVFGKIRSNTEKSNWKIATANLALLTLLRQLKVPIITIYSDHMAKAPRPIQLIYKELLTQSDQIIFPCRSIKNSAETWHNRKLPSQ